MKKFSIQLLAKSVYYSRKQLKLSQIQLSELTGIHRSMIGRLENEEYTPSIEQMERLAEVLNIDIASMFIDDTLEAKHNKISSTRKYNIAVAGTGYVGLSLAVLLAQHNHVTAVDVIEAKVKKINNKLSPIHDECHRRK